MKKEITSLQNDLVKKVVLLQSKSRARKKEGLFVVEGIREITLAIESGIHFQSLLTCRGIASEDDLLNLKKLLGTDKKPEESFEWIEVSEKVYQHLAHRKTTEGVIGIARTDEFELENLDLGENPLVLVAEASEKPGNIGALLRTADAARLDAVIIANPRTDLYNPNIIRSSVGCLFTQKVVTASSEEIISYLKKQKISILAAALSEYSMPYYQADYRTGTAIVLGTEDKGLSDPWLEQADLVIQIPMGGKIDSLNVSVSGAILIFEAKRQREWAP